MKRYVKSSYARDYFKRAKEAKQVIDRFSPEQVAFVEKAYADCIKDYVSSREFSAAKFDWSVEAAEDEIFDNDDDFFKLFDAIDTIHEDDAIAWS